MADATQPAPASWPTLLRNLILAWTDVGQRLAVLLNALPADAKEIADSVKAASDGIEQHGIGIKL